MAQATITVDVANTEMFCHLADLLLYATQRLQAADDTEALQFINAEIDVMQKTLKGGVK